MVDLLDYDVRFGQGFLFSPPRPVRTEVLQGIAERPVERAPPPPAARAAESRRRRPAARAVEPAESAPAARATAIAQIARGIARRAQG